MPFSKRRSSTSSGCSSTRRSRAGGSGSSPRTSRSMAWSRRRPASSAAASCCSATPSPDPGRHTIRALYGTPRMTSRAVARVGHMAGATKDHLIGLLLGAEEDWPQAFEQILRFVGPLEADGTTHRLASERLTIEPFDLVDPVRTGLVIDRLAHWYFHPREWLKKAALVNGTYLLNSPFTFQSMEKHSAYCAMLRLGLHVPKTILVPYKNPVDNHRWTYTSATYNEPFDLDVLAAEVGYPLYMKPFDGGGWRGVSRVDDQHDLHTAYDDSGEMLMHLQATVDYEHFARALSIGPETMVMDFRPEQPMHQRYAVNHGFLSESAGKQAVAISRIVNAFFRWEFNSCEMLVVGDDVHPIDYANACPDVAVTSLHYYFPWAITALVRWSTYCVVNRRRAKVDLGTSAYFKIADDESLSY